MNERVQLKKDVQFRWCKPLQKPGEPVKNPASNKQPKSKVPHMKRRRLTDDMVTVHNKANSRSVTLNRYVSKRAYNMGMRYAYIVGNETGKFIVLTTDSGNGLFAKLAFNTKNKQATGIISNFQMVQDICLYFRQPEGDYYILVEEIKSADAEHSILLKLMNIVEAQPLEQANQNRHPKYNLTGESLDSLILTEATDKQLYDELRRRGYEGKMTKISTLE